MTYERIRECPKCGCQPITEWTDGNAHTINCWKCGHMLAGTAGEGHPVFEDPAWAATGSLN